MGCKVNISNEPLEPVTLEPAVQKRLLKQVLKGKIIRADFPELWGEREIRVILPDEPKSIEELSIN